MKIDSMHQSKKNIQGIFWILIGSASFSLLLALAKLNSNHLNSSYIVLFYKFFMLLFIIPWVFSEGIKVLYSKKIILYFISALFSTSASLCLFYSLKSLNLASVTSLGYLEKVLLSLIGILHFREASSKSKLLAILVSFIAAIIIVQPNIFEIQSSHLSFDNKYFYVFCSIILWVAHCITVKLIGRHDSDKTQSFYTILFTVVIAAFSTNLTADNFSNITINKVNLFYLIIMAFCSLLRVFCGFKALKNTDLSVVVPFGYSKIIFSALFGALFFAEYPNPSAYLGFILLIACAFLLLRSEQKITKL